MINLRTETVLERPAFSKLLDKRRCIVPADGFYEWQDTGEKRKQPFYITSADGSPLAFAALWDRWTPPEQRGQDGVEPLRTVTLITGEPNELVGRIHNRMVVCLPESAWDAWLDPDVHKDEAAKLLVTMPADAMRAYPVVPLVSNVRNDGPELLEALPGH
jgi:putative SOS response-associated peptidase YedK